MRILRTLTLLSLCALPVTAAHATTVYNAASDFSLTSNPNGVWSYGYGANVTPFTVTGTAYQGHAGYEYWSTGVDGLPLVGLNTNSASTPGFSPDPPSTDLWLHPGIDNTLPAQVVFTAPDSDTYNIDAIFQRADLNNGAGNGVGVAIYLNGSPILDRTLLAPGNYLESISFLQTLYLNAGDTLAFAVDPYGDYNFDSTGLNLTITQDPVPEPSSMILVATGLMGAAAAARRRFLA